MPQKVTILKAFVASPSDVLDERAGLEEVIRELNDIWIKKQGYRLELLRWETDTYPNFGQDAQDVISQQIGEDYDIFIGIMWAQYGTPTGRAGSGTVEEFNRVYERFKSSPESVHIMFYFKDAPISPSELDPDQLQKIIDFKKRLKKVGGLWWTFRTLEEFQLLIRVHLSRTVQKFVKQAEAEKITFPTHEAVPAQSETPSINETDLEDEVGFIDLLEIANDSFERNVEVVEQITQATNLLTEKMDVRTSEFLELQKVPDQLNYKATKRIAAKTAEDMEEFVSKINVNVPIYSESLKKAIDAFANAVSLSREFDENDTTQIQQALKNISLIHEAILKSYEPMNEFRSSVKNLPPITTRFNRAKRKTIITLDNLLSELGVGENLIAEAKKSIQQLLSTSQD